MEDQQGIIIHMFNGNLEVNNIIENKDAMIWCTVLWQGVTVSDKLISPIECAQVLLKLTLTLKNGNWSTFVIWYFVTEMTCRPWYYNFLQILFTQLLALVSTLMKPQVWWLEFCFTALLQLVPCLCLIFHEKM